MSRKKNPTWERSSQVDKIMKGNKPVKVREGPRYIGWESCVKEFFEKQKREWERRREE